MKEGHRSPQCRMPLKCSACSDPHPRPFVPEYYAHISNLKKQKRPPQQPNVHFAQSIPDNRNRITEPPLPSPYPHNSNPNQQTFCSLYELPITNKINVKLKQRPTILTPKALRKCLTNVPATKMELNPAKKR